MLENIKNRITDYIGFDVDKLLNAGDFVTIFGGAVRDSIADLEIHDIDVLCLWESMRKCEQLLEIEGYVFDHSAYTKDFDKVYDGIKVVHEPHSWIKIVDEGFGKEIRRIQLIRPQVFKEEEDFMATSLGIKSPLKKSRGFNEMKEAYYNLLENVDLSCCGVSISSSGFKEEYENAVVHCLCHVYEEIPDALMITDRINGRKEKLNQRGWEDIHGLLSKRKREKLELTLKQLSLNKKVKKIIEY